MALNPTIPLLFGAAFFLSSQAHAQTHEAIIGSPSLPPQFLARAEEEAPRAQPVVMPVSMGEPPRLAVAVEAPEKLPPTPLEGAVKVTIAPAIRLPY